MQLGEKKLIVQRASVGAKQNINNVSHTSDQNMKNRPLISYFNNFQIISNLCADQSLGLVKLDLA